MTRILKSLLVTTAVCGLLAAAPAQAASDAKTTTAPAVAAAPSSSMPTTTASSANTTVTHLRLTNRDVKEIQNKLAEKGFYKSKVDGQFGATTQDAMRGYQTSAGLEANGYPTAATLEKLGVKTENAPMTGDAEPPGKGGVVYTESIEKKNVVTTKGSRSFSSVESTSQNGGDCTTCTNGPMGNGGTSSMHSNEY
jgi:peptidoglycan hydrolase-like protein with peptidoglycan-binding domain